MTRTHPKTSLIRENPDFEPTARRDERTDRRHVRLEGVPPKAGFAGAGRFPDWFPKDQRFIFSALILFLAGSGCAPAIRPEIRLSVEPTIERALAALARTPEGKPMVEFLYKNPVRFDYDRTPELCTKFYFNDSRILLSHEFKKYDAKLTALELAQAAYIYRLHILTGLEEQLSEEAELAALFQARVALELRLTNKDLEQNRFGREFRSGLCVYLMQGANAAAMAARNTALSPAPQCQRPYETINTQRAWLEKTGKAINDDTIFQFLYNRDLQKARKGSMTMADVMKNDAVLRAMPMYEIYRYQRMLYDKQNETFSRLEKYYSVSLKEDEAWRAVNRPLLYGALHEFSACNLPK